MEGKVLTGPATGGLEKISQNES
ncbi:hypothetical protein [Mucilaginibacter humi]